MNDGEVVLFVPGKYSTHCGFVRDRNLIKSFPRTHLVDDPAGYGRGIGLGRDGFGNDQLAADRNICGVDLVPILQVTYSDTVSFCDIVKRIALLHRVASTR